MIRTRSLQPKYLVGTKYTRHNMMLEEDILSIVRAIKESEDDIRNGRLYDGIEALKELRKKYEYR